MNKIKLRYPVEFDGKTIEELEIRRPKVKDLIEIQKKTSDKAEQDLLLFSRLTKQPIELIEELDIVDYMNLQKTYEGFLSD